jgi:hypothetical protein
MLQLISLSGVEPVTTDEAKLAARVDNDLGDTSSLDPLIAGLITSAREAAEHLTGRKYRPQVLRAELVDWAEAEEGLPVFAATACTVRTWNGSGWTELSISAYEYAADNVTGTRTVLAPALGTSWPTLLERAVGPRIQVDLTAGPASPATVPEQVKLFIKAQVSAWVNNPDAASTKALEVSPLAARLLDAENLRT